MPKHVLTLIGTVLAWFGLLWFAVVVLGQTPTRAAILSVLTLLLLGLGITFSVASFRGDDQQR